MCFIPFSHTFCRLYYQKSKAIKKAEGSIAGIISFGSKHRRDDVSRHRSTTNSHSS